MLPVRFITSILCMKQYITFSYLWLYVYTSRSIRICPGQNDNEDTLELKVIPPLANYIFIFAIAMVGKWKLGG